MATMSGIIAGQSIDDTLIARLNETYPAGGETFRHMKHLCQQGIEEGWMCNQGDVGRRFGRVIEPGKSTNDFSVDVVFLNDIRGPHHVHPTGEIGAVMPLDDGAKFDKWGEGWFAYPPGSAHWPTVRGGSALVLYFLPEGKIEFTGKEPPAKKA